jgi:cell division protein FtsB
VHLFLLEITAVWFCDSNQTHAKFMLFLHKALQKELESLQSEGQKKDEDLNRLEQQLHDAGEEKQLAEKKGIAVMKDLRRQLAAERKRSEKLQERMRDLLNEGTHIKTGKCHACSGCKGNRRNCLQLLSSERETLYLWYVVLAIQIGILCPLMS